jgi:hypothetical protein
MKTYRSRNDSSYRKKILQKLSLDNLMSSAILINKDYDKSKKIIRIDFFGLSATLLLDIGKNFTDGSVAKAFQDIFHNMTELNKQGIFFKVRFLFSYMYSDFAYSLIEAEKTHNRAAINETTHVINFESDNNLSDADFFSSSTFRNQNNSLKQIQKLTEMFDFGVNTQNKLVVRFSCLPINYCGLIINDFATFDAYCYSKKEKASESLSYSMPVTTIDKSTDSVFYDELDDHFRYLWNHESTLFCEDATYFDKNKTNSLTELKRPNEISLEAKANRINEIMGFYKREISDISLNSWKFRVKNKILANSRVPQIFPSKESLFIACCWEQQGDNLFKPNHIAQEFHDLIIESFGKNTKVLTPLLVEPSPGSQLPEKIYSQLKQSTLALIILTNDIELKNGGYLSSQNVIHELGFMMKHLNARRTGRVLILKERGCQIPSNVSDLEYVEFEKIKIF